MTNLNEYLTQEQLSSYNSKLITRALRLYQDKKINHNQKELFNDLIEDLVGQYSNDFQDGAQRAEDDDITYKTIKLYLDDAYTEKLIEALKKAEKDFASQYPSIINNPFKSGKDYPDEEYYNNVYDYFYQSLK